MLVRYESKLNLCITYAVEPQNGSSKSNRKIVYADVQIDTTPPGRLHILCK